jgi:O-antigen ligase/tetratricopeptide (TPR) repeat protein
VAPRRSRAARTRDVKSSEAQPQASWTEACCQLAGVVGPLAFHTAGTLGFESTKALLIRVLAIILTLGRLGIELGRIGGQPGPFSALRLAFGASGAAVRPILFALAAFGLATLLSTALSVTPLVSLLGMWDRQQGLLTTLCWLALGVAAALAGRRPDGRRGLVIAWAVASAPVCLYAFVQQAHLDPVDWLNQPLGVTSTLGSSTALAAYLAMLAPLTFALTLCAARRDDEASAEKDGWRAWVADRRFQLAAWSALLTAQIAALVMTQVRGGLLAGVVGLAVVVVALLWPGRRRLAIVLGVLGLVGLILATVGIAAMPRPDVGDGSDSSAHQRVLIWQDALRAATGPRVIAGYGPESQLLALEPSYPVDLAQRFENARFDRAHNLLLDQLLTTGILGTAALLVLLWFVVRVGLRRVAVAEAGGAWLDAGLLGALTAWFTANLFAFDSSVTGVLAWMIGGLIVGPLIPTAPQETTPEPRTSRRGGRRGRETPAVGLTERVRLQATAGLAMLAIGLSALPWVTAPFLADLYHTRALGLRAGEAPGSSIRQEIAAAQTVPWLDVPLLALGETFQDLARTTNLGQSQVPGSFEDLFELTPTGREGQFEAARLALERAVAINPRDPYTHAALARHWMARAEASRDPDQRTRLYGLAVEAYDRAIEAGPSRASFYDEAAVALTRWGRPELAIERLRQADALTHPTSERLARRADALVVADDLAGARALYEQALALDARSAPAHAGLAALDRQAGDLAAALDHAQRAARFQMRNWEYHRDLALAYRDLGQASEALMEARTARRLAPAWEFDDLNALIQSLATAP